MKNNILCHICILLLCLESRLTDAARASSPCPTPNWLFDKDSNRCLFMKDIDGMNFFEAVQLCDKLGSVLVTAKTEQDVEFLAKNYRISGNIWLGLNDLISRGKPKWADGTPLGRLTFWASSFPKRSNTGDQCAFLDVVAKKWKDRSCYDRSYRTVCQISDVSLCTSNPFDCDHKCLDLGFRSRTCICKTGYELIESTRCQDIDECSVKNGGCEQQCNNTIGSYICRCNTGTPRLGGRVCQEVGLNDGLSTMEIISLIITITFPTLSIFTCVIMACSGNKSPSQEETNPKPEEEQPVEEEDAEQYDDQDHDQYDQENFDEEYYDDDDYNRY